MEEKFDSPVFAASLVQPGIVNLAFKKVKEVTLNDIKNMTSALRKLGNGNKVGVFLTFESFIQPTEEVMAEEGRKEIRKYVFATAYVVKSIAIRIGIKFFIKFRGNKDGLPRNIFETKEKAISWLRKVRDEQKALAHS